MLSGITLSRQRLFLFLATFALVFKIVRRSSWIRNLISRFFGWDRLGHFGIGDTSERTRQQLPTSPLDESNVVKSNVIQPPTRTVPSCILVVTVNDVLAGWEGGKLEWIDSKAPKILSNQLFHDYFDLYLIVQLSETPPSPPPSSSSSASSNLVESQESLWRRLLLSVLASTTFEPCKLLFCETLIGRSCIARHLEPNMLVEGDLESLKHMKTLSRTANLCLVGPKSIASLDFPVESFPNFSEIGIISSFEI
jgi:hypothetical protein